MRTASWICFANEWGMLAMVSLTWMLRWTLVPLERRVLRWHCGCNPGRMMEILAPSMRHDPEELFGAETEIEIRCPRCAGRHAIRRAELAAFVAERE